jgi:phosphopantothenoylcysteine decarboxylase / phosphopantothenate---cysteine ligase
MILAGKRVLLIIGGGIAAYKALDLIRRLRERGASVRCILTAGAQQFVTPLAASALTGGTTRPISAISVSRDRRMRSWSRLRPRT